jgi:hypothetical protein
MRRHAIGMLSILLFCGAVAFWFWPPTRPWLADFQASCWKGGLFCGVWWLAWPQAVNVPLWIWGSIPLMILVLILRPKMFLILLPLVITLAIIWPRSRQKAVALAKPARRRSQL